MLSVLAAIYRIYDSFNWCLKTPRFIDIVKAYCKWKHFDIRKDAKTSLEISLGIKIYYYSKDYNNSLEDQYDVRAIIISMVLVLSTCQVDHLLF